jgi:autotransporter-associated beta strand protein
VGTGPGQVTANPTEDGDLNRRMGFAAFGGDRVVDFGAPVQLLSTSLAGRGFTLGAASADSKITVVNDIALNGGARTLLVNDGSASIDAELSGSISSATGTLLKTGTGTLALTGTNSYGSTSGGTEVQAGVLIVGGDALSNTSKLVISGGKVQPVGTETVDTLFFGEVQQAAGTWGSSASSAEPAFQDDTRFSGTGVIVVTTGPSAGTGFDSWKTANGATGGINDDHDNDGVDNGVEYFLGGPNGNTTGFTPLPGVTNTGGTLSVTWTKGSGYSGTYATHFVVETSETLSGTWIQETLPGGNITDDPGFVKITFPSPLGTKKFARLKVTGP